MKLQSPVKFKYCCNEGVLMKNSTSKKIFSTQLQLMAHYLKTYICKH